jgi:hypothetical protein
MSVYSVSLGPVMDNMDATFQCRVRSLLLARKYL